MASSSVKAGSTAAAAASGSKGENDLLLVTYRDHHNAYPASDPNVTFINRAKSMTAPRRFLQFVFSAIMVHYFLWILPMVFSLYFFYSIGYWWISAIMLAAYLPSFFDGAQFKSGRPWAAFRQHPLWRLTSRYIGIEVLRTKKLEPGKRYLFGLYPHGILILSRIAIYGGVWELLFPGIETRVLGASPMFLCPGSREICLWMSAVDAAKRVAVACIEKFGLHLMVYPGGSDEIFETDPNSSATTLIVRKGFIKLAIQTGSEIVPAFIFGEKWLYYRKSVSKSVQKFFMKNFRMPLILFWGRYFTWLPYHDKNKAFLTVVFGSPIPVTQMAEPSDEYIEELWIQYIDQVKNIYETYKERFGYPEDEHLVLKEAKKSGGEKAAAVAAAAKKAAPAEVAASSIVPQTPAEEEVQPENIIEDEASAKADVAALEASE